MLPMKSRNTADGINFHSTISPRFYDSDAAHRPRILKAREFVAECPGSIIELGCGTADICGAFSHERSVKGYDCSEGAIREARARFPQGEFFVAGIHEVEPTELGVIVLSEVLEHLEDPFAIVEKHLPLAEFSVISHPIHEPLTSGMSAGEHQWGEISMADHISFFTRGGHEVLHTEEIDLGGLRVVMSRGRRIK